MTYGEPHGLLRPPRSSAAASTARRSRATPPGAGSTCCWSRRTISPRHTSSASSKLIHGGLRYLEQYEFRLVRESLHEREILLRTAPHIVRPLEFVLPDPPGGRPCWMIRARPPALRSARRPRQPAPLARRRQRATGARARRSSPASASPPIGTPGSTMPAWSCSTRSTPPSAAPRSPPAPNCSPPAATARPGPPSSPAAAPSRARMIVNAAGPWVAEVLHRPARRRGRERASA